MTMLDTTQADAFNTARGYTDWSDLDVADKSAALYRANDYIEAHYDLRDPEEGEETDLAGRLATARYIIARALVSVSGPAVVSAPIVKDSRELSGMKVSREYGEAPADPYPTATAFLAPYITSASNSVTFGRLVR